MKQWAKNNKTNVYWIFTEADHGQGPINGL